MRWPDITMVWLRESFQWTAKILLLEKSPRFSGKRNCACRLVFFSLSSHVFEVTLGETLPASASSTATNLLGHTTHPIHHGPSRLPTSFRGVAASLTPHGGCSAVAISVLAPQQTSWEKRRVRRLQRVRVLGKHVSLQVIKLLPPSTPPTKKQRCLVFVRICGGTEEVDNLELLDCGRPLKIKKYLSERSLGAHHYADGIPLIYNSPSGIHSLPCFAGNSSHWSSAGCKEFADLAGVRLQVREQWPTIKNGKQKKTQKQQPKIGP